MRTDIVIPPLLDLPGSEMVYFCTLGEHNALKSDSIAPNSPLGAEVFRSRKTGERDALKSDKPWSLK